MLLVSAGSNAQGQLATGDCEDAHVFTNCCFQDCEPGRLPAGVNNFVQIAFGSNHTLVLLDGVQDASSSPKRELWGSGDGSKYQLGLSVNTSTPIFVPIELGLATLGLRDYTIKTIAACWETSYVVLSHPEQGDVLLSMGSDDFGDLGIGGLAKSSGHAKPIHRVEFTPDCLGTEDVSSVRVHSLRAGSHHVIAQLSVEYPDKTVRERLVGWGTSRHGQLGTHRWQVVHVLGIRR